ncbi:MAG: hypothetical protein ACOYO1_12780, partial [Bacteroidales bacterium]
MKKLFIIITAILIFCSINISVITAQQLILPQTNACLNDTALVPLNFSNIDSLAALTLYISYDTSVLTYTGITNVNALTPGIMSGVPISGPNAWQVVISWVDNTLNGVNLISGKLCDLKFKYKGGNSNLNFLINSELVNQELIIISPSYINGSISPAILSQPIAKQVCEDRTTNFSLTATTGSSFQWQVQNGAQWDNLQNNTTYSGVATNTLQIQNALSSLNNKQYRCVVTKYCAEYSNSALLTVYPKPHIVVNNDTTICSSNSIVLNASATTGTGILVYSWDQGLGTGIIHTVTPSTNSTYHLTVTDANTCNANDSVVITVLQLPSAAGVITGSTTVCQGQSSVIYTVPVITNATSYIWTLPSGTSGSSITNSITVNYSNNALSGNISVKGHNSCSDGTVSSIAITVNPLPHTSGTISGLATVCQGQTSVNYTVATITNATSYIWTLPTAASGSSATNSIIVNYAKTAISGNITVKGHNSCGDGVASTFVVTVNPLPLSAGVISGLTTVCQGQSSVTYTVPAITNATSYVWILPAGVTGSGTTNSISVNYTNSAISGNIVVKGVNACGNGDSSILAITVNPLPLTAGTIIGSTTVCQGQSTVIYSVPTISNATSYVWTLPTGASGTSTTSSITVNYSLTAISGNISVKGINSCGDGIASIQSITVNPIPLSSGTISGLTTVCQGQSTVTYSVPTISNATSYVWTLPTGASGTSTTNSITVNYSLTAVSGDITVKGHNSCGDGSASSLTINVNPLVGSPGVISGLTTVCQGQTSVTYTVPSITNATSYAWTLPTGASGVSTTNSITVNYSSSAISGNITVKGQNTCGDGSISSLAVTVNPLPIAAGTITGSTTVCQGQNSVIYTVPVISNATSYIWTLPTGASGTSTTNSITVNYSISASSGNITVKGNNSCGNGAVSSIAITVNPLVAAAGTITGTTTVCQGQSTVNYTVPAIANATSYIWTLPTGASGTSTTNSITVNYSLSAASGNITVKGQNSCGDGSVSSLAVTVNPLPIAAGTITGTATVCQGQSSVNYTVPAITNATSYAWTLPTGASGVSTTNSITVNYSSSAISGNITVKGQNTCGDGSISSLAVTVNPLPIAAGTITGSTTVCQGQNSVIYTVPVISNATSYIWTLPTGASGTSTTNSITVNYSISASSGNITVKGNNSCGNGAVSSIAITVNPLVAAAGTITGTTTVCQGQSTVNYTVPAIANATSYIWTLPTGASGTST